MAAPWHRYIISRFLPPQWNSGITISIRSEAADLTALAKISACRAWPPFGNIAPLGRPVVPLV